MQRPEIRVRVMLQVEMPHQAQRVPSDPGKQQCTQDISRDGHGVSSTSFGKPKGVKFAPAAVCASEYKHPAVASDAYSPIC